MLLLADKTGLNSSSEYLEFATKYAKIFSGTIKSNMDSKDKSGVDFRLLHFKRALQMLVSIPPKNKKAIVNCKDEIIHFLGLSCPNYRKNEIHNLLKTISKFDAGIIDKIPDSQILSWEKYQFIAALRVLNEQRNTRSRRRSESLCIESQILPGLIQSTYARIGNNLSVESMIEDINEQMDKSKDDDKEKGDNKRLFSQLISLTSQAMLFELNRMKKSRESSYPGFDEMLHTLIKLKGLMPTAVWGDGKKYDHILNNISKPKRDSMLKESISSVERNLQNTHKSEIELNRSNRNLIDATSIIIQLSSLKMQKTPRKIDFIDKYPVIQLSGAFSHEQSQIFSKQERIGVVENMVIIDEMYSNWDKHSNLYKLFSSSSSEEKLPWRFDGFGKEMGFKKSLILNSRFANQLTHGLSDFSNVLLKSFDLTNRYAKYCDIIDTAIHYFEKAEGETMNLKTLIQFLLLGIGKKNRRPFEKIILMEVKDESEASVFPGGIFGKPVEFRKQKTTVELIHEPNLSMGLVKLLQYLGLDFKLNVPLNIESNIIELRKTKILLNTLREDQVDFVEEDMFSAGTEPEEIPEFAAGEPVAPSDELQEDVFAAETEPEEIPEFAAGEPVAPNNELVDDTGPEEKEQTFVTQAQIKMTKIKQLMDESDLSADQMINFLLNHSESDGSD